MMAMKSINEDTIIISKPILLNVYLNAHSINNQFVVELNNRADNLSRKIINRVSYTLDEQLEHQNTFTRTSSQDTMTKADMYRAVFVLLEKNNLLVTRQINFSTHKLLIISSESVDISKESARLANICVDIDKNTVVPCNQELNFVVSERALHSRIIPFNPYKCEGCDKTIVKVVDLCGRCGKKQSRMVR